MTTKTNAWQPFYINAGDYSISFPVVGGGNSPVLSRIPSWSAYVRAFYDKNPITDVRRYTFSSLDLSRWMMAPNENTNTYLARMGASSIQTLRGPLLPSPVVVDGREALLYPLFYPAILLALENADTYSTLTFDPLRDVMYFSDGALTNIHNSGMYGLTRTKPFSVYCNDPSAVPPYINSCLDYCMREENMGNCDVLMRAYCFTNPTAPSCACMRSAAAAPIDGVQYNPLCVDDACFRNGYPTASMLAAKRGGCDIVSCDAQIKLNAIGDLKLNSINISQNCGNTVAQAAAGPSVAGVTTASGAVAVDPNAKLINYVVIGLLVISVVAAVVVVLL
jgi:hypothetical protein